MGLDNSIVGKIVTIGAGNGNFFEKSRYLGIRVRVLRQRMCGHYEVKAVDPYDVKAEDIGDIHFSLEDFVIESEPTAKIGEPTAKIEEATSKRWYGVVTYDEDGEPAIVKAFFIDDETADIVKSIFDITVDPYDGEVPEFLELTDAAGLLQ